VADSQASLLEQVRSGSNRQLLIMAAGGLLPLSPEDLIPLQVGFARGGDSELASRAIKALSTVDPRIATPFLEQRAGADVLAFFAAESSHPQVLETIVRRRDVPRRLLVELARRIPPELQEILILRQDAILEEPAILEALEANPLRTSYIQRRIAEYREHLLPRERSPAPAGVTAGPIVEATDQEVVVALSAVKALPAEGEVETQTGLSEGQIRMLPIPVRLKLARGASRVMRGVLLRDSNVQVSLTALLSNNLSDQEVEHTAASRAVAVEVLEAIYKKRDWISRYNVARCLIFNPRTPLPIAIRLVPRLAVRDLRELGRDKNVPDAVRSTALRLYRIKQQ
jgi:hypothetical protein